MYTDFIVHVGMPEVILLNPRIPNPDTDKLLHGEERRETEEVRRETEPHLTKLWMRSENGRSEPQNGRKTALFSGQMSITHFRQEPFGPQ